MSEDTPLIHTAFRAHARSRPEATALRHRDVVLTYAALDRISDALAARLSERGVGPGRIVPLLLSRAPHQVAVELAVLKCGAAYANIDPAWPDGRVGAVLEQVSARLVVTEGGREVGPYPVFEVADVAHVAADAPEFASAPQSGDDPAMIFFTSGTTGTPKGVVVPHRAVTRMFRPGGLPGFGPGHVSPQAAAPMWDMHAYDVWGQLTSGGAVAMFPRTPVLPSMLREQVRTAGVDTMFLTSSLFNLFVDEDLECFDGVRQLIVGGEKLSPHHIRAVLERFPETDLRNGYGPAENCMLTTTHVITPADCAAPEGIPVGRPVPGTEVYVLDEDGRPCRTGQLGEVVAAGNGLAVGYLGHDGLTAEKFPTVTVEGRPARVYRTGDLGFFDASGTLHFRGRLDRQVKVGGVRIEPAEIEFAARELAGVRDCVVLPLTGPGEQVAGLALCYAASADGPDERAMRAELLRRLPANMVPHVLRRLEHFPLTQNGKVDQAELRRVVASPRPRTRPPGRAGEEGGVRDRAHVSHDVRAGGDLAG
ncbi:amino acid adenylation domain-containing protein [Streptomyces seoulensis]